MSHLSIKVTSSLFVIVVAIMGWATWVIANNHKPYNDFSVQNGCDLHLGSCLALSTSGARIELSILPLEIPLLKPLILTVNVNGLEVDSMNVVFTGIDVDMGRLVYPLKSINGLVYEGSASLSICSSQKMKWQALVLIKLDNREITVPFEFETEYRSNFKLI